METVPQVADVVGETMWTVAEAPEAKDVGPNTRWPEEIEKPLAAPEIDQLRPPFVGNTSSTLTPLAVPGPPLAIVTW